MRTIAAVLSLMIFAASPSQVQAGDAETIAEINTAAAALDAAFEKRDEAAVKRLMTADHMAVTPYYDDPQSVDEQIASLPKLKYKQTNLSEAAVALLGADAALRTFAAELNGTFQGRPIPRRVFVSALWVKGESGWQEKFYQVTAMRRGGHKQASCKEAIGSYLTKNVAKGGNAGNVTSRSVISLARSGLLLFTDSGEGGESGFAPFSDGRGTWRCDANGEIIATTLDFTEPTAERPKAEIGRLDLKLTYDAATRSLSGTGTLYFVPIDQDPLASSEVKDGRQFDITGQRVEAP